MINGHPQEIPQDVLVEIQNYIVFLRKCGRTFDSDLPTPYLRLKRMKTQELTTKAEQCGFVSLQEMLDHVQTREGQEQGQGGES